MCPSAGFVVVVSLVGFGGGLTSKEEKTPGGGGGRDRCRRRCSIVGASQSQNIRCILDDDAAGRLAPRIRGIEMCVVLLQGCKMYK